MEFIRTICYTNKVEKGLFTLINKIFTDSNINRKRFGGDVAER